LEKCSELAWSDNANTRMIFHIADAPCHGKYFRDGKQDKDCPLDYDGKLDEESGVQLPDHQGIDPNGRVARELLRSLMVKERAQYVFCEINASTRPMINVFNRLLAEDDDASAASAASASASKSRGAAVAAARAGDNLQIITKPLASAKDIVRIAETSVTDSIRRSQDIASADVGSEAKELAIRARTKLASMLRSKKLEVVADDSEVEDNDQTHFSVARKGDSHDSEPDDAENEDSPLSKKEEGAHLDENGAQLVLMRRVKVPTSIAELCRGAQPLEKDKWRRMKIQDTEADKVGEGAERKVFKATEFIPSDAPKHLVLKLAKDEGGDYEAKNAMKELQCQTAASFLAYEFSKTLKENSISTVKIRYLKAKVIHFLSSNGQRRWGSVENILEDKTTAASASSAAEYLKWSNNAGFARNAADPHFSQELQAFSHWTHHITKGYLMVVDLQGFRQGQDFVLTDPAVHCLNTTLYGATNFGAAGFNDFYRTHKCNGCCQKLGLPTAPPAILEEEDELAEVLGTLRLGEGLKVGGSGVAAFGARGAAAPTGSPPPPAAAAAAAAGVARPANSSRDKVAPSYLSASPQKGDVRLSRGAGAGTGAGFGGGGATPPQKSVPPRAFFKTTAGPDMD
jgi:ribosomal protein L30/L7E